jgi:hypothetical protein
MTDQLPQHLVRLGDALQRATTADLAARGSRRRRGHWRRPRPVALVIATIVVGIPAAALAATVLISTSEVAQSLPQGTRALIGTDPSCTVVVANVEYHCVLANPPAQDAGGPGSVPGSGAGGTSTCSEVVHIGARGYCVDAEPAQGATAGAIVKPFCAVVQGAGSGVTGPSCVVLKPSPLRAGGGSGWTGTVEATVDATNHVNGGCRSFNTQGTEWDCYLGQAAVAQNIISEGFLGQYAPVPGVG